MKRTILFFFLLSYLTGCQQTSREAADTIRELDDSSSEQLLAETDYLIPDTAIRVTVQPKEYAEPAIADSAITSFLSSLGAPPQRFLINANTGGEFTGKNGTRIIIKPNSFTTHDNKPVNELVEIDLKESYHLSDIVRENHNTIVQKSIYETKGGVYLQAYQNNKPIKIDKDQAVEVVFPETISSGKGFSYVRYDNASGPHKSSEQLKTLAEKNEAEANSSLKLIDTTAIRTYFLNTLRYPDAAKRNEISASLDISIVFDQSGNSSVVWLSPINKVFQQEVENTVAALPFWFRSGMGTVPVNTALKLNIDFNLRRQNQIAINYTSNIISVNTVSKSEAYQKVAANTVLTDKMGWILCQRKVGGIENTADIIVPSDTKSSVRLILKNRRVVVSGERFMGYTRFKNLPVNDKAVIIAMRSDDGKLYCALQQLTLNKQKVVTLNWQIATKETIDKMIDSI